MAMATGTATSHTDLWTKLLAFLQTNSALVAAGQTWTVAWSAPVGAPNSTDIVLKGPGLAGQDEVFIGLRRVDRDTADEFEIQIAGMSGILDDATAFNGHVNVQPHVVKLFVDNGPMTYWFVANGRRFMIVVKISTVYEAAYAGLFLPYAYPINYSYPLFVGASAGSQNNVTSWRSTSDAHRHFVNAYYHAGNVYEEPSAWMLSPQGDWLRCSAYGDDSTVGIGPKRFFNGYGITADQISNNFGYNTIRQRQRACFGGQAYLSPHTLVQASPGDQCYGILDGTSYVTGYDNSAENIITVSGVDHLVVQDAFRAGVDNYWAMRLA